MGVEIALCTKDLSSSVEKEGDISFLASVIVDSKIYLVLSGTLYYLGYRVIQNRLPYHVIQKFSRYI